jgi:hypothetical protein
MAHLTTEQIDQAAAAQADAEKAAPDPTPPVQPTLEYGAEGPELEKLVNLLRVLGYHSNNVAQGTSHTLDETVLADVRAAQITLGITEPATDATGERVGPATWTALYGAAEVKLEADETPAAEAHETPAVVGGEPAAQ